MSDMREVYLREMGLGPVWRKRGTSPVPSQEPVAQLDAQVAQVDQPVVVKAVNVEGRRAEILQLDAQMLKSSVAQCTACGLSQSRVQPVLGMGDMNADWLFIGEAPGAEEDAVGEPFVGQSGKLLDNMLKSIRLKRGVNVYITNVVKCRPPGNRDPRSEEVTACEPYLAKQIALIKPKLIVALGKVAADHLLHTDHSIASLRGKIHDCEGTPLVVTYHPAHLLRNMADKARAWEDLCFAVNAMQGFIAAQSIEN